MNFCLSNVWLVPLLPLIGFLLNGLPTAVGVKLPKKYVHTVACGVMFAAFAVAFGAFLAIASMPEATRHVTIKLWPWIYAGAFKVDIAYLIDPLSCVMMLIITGVGSLIHLYSIGYMHEEPSYARFFTYLNLFVFMMLQLVMGDNIFLLFVGWEGVGLASYLLIGFWFKEKANGAAGMKAFIVNRVGDFGMMVGTLTLFWTLTRIEGATPTMTFMVLKNTIAGLANYPMILGASAATIICIFLFIGATGKSAQIPLYVWLPDAMAGPTPVSALIHAATMVTAGVYMIARMNWLFTLAPAALTVIATVGAFTALFAATIGFAQNDIKKVLAYSTVSQLGYMFLAMGSAAYVAGVFHLMTHAFFKACMFLGSGSVIMGMHHEQDMRRMGNLKKYMPKTFKTFFVATLAIAGIFPFSGFFSKDEILWMTFSRGEQNGWYYFLWFVGLCSAACTAFYMFRLVMMTFYGEFRGNDEKIAHEVEHDKHAADEYQKNFIAGILPPIPPAADDGHGHGDHAHAAHAEAHGDHVAHDDHGHGHGHHGELVPHESPWTVTVPLIVLAFLSVVGGFLGVPYAIGHFIGIPNILEHWLSPVIHAHAHHEVHAIEYILMVVSLAVAISALMLSRWIYSQRPDIPKRFAEKFSCFYKWVANKYFVDELYFNTFVKGTLRLDEFLASFDRKVVDGLVNLVGTAGRIYSDVIGWFDKLFVDGVVNGVGQVAVLAGAQLRRVQTGRIQTYAYVAMLGVLVVLIVKIIL